MAGQCHRLWGDLRTVEPFGFVEELAQWRPQRPALQLGFPYETGIDDLTFVDCDDGFGRESKLEEIDIVPRPEVGAENVTGGSEEIGVDSDPGLLLQFANGRRPMLLVASHTAARNRHDMPI